MALYPEVQRHAQAELDSVLGVGSEVSEPIGPERLPTLADRIRLPYIEAILKECLRWRPVVAISESINFNIG